MTVGSREQERSARSSGGARRGVAMLLLAALAATPVLAQRPNIELPPAKQATENRREPATYTVPNLVGHRLDEARRILESEGFKFQEVSEDGSNNGERVVTRTLPAAGAQVRQPEVTLYHRAEAASVVPSILGSDCNQARLLLERAKFTLARCEPGEVTNRYRPGAINRQAFDTRPDARGNRAVAAWTEPLPPGGAPPGTVKPPPTELPRVPDLIASTCAAATGRLQALEARPVCLPGKATGRFRPGQINEQQPAAGQLMPKERLVQVAIEPEPGVPDLRGQSCAAAKGTLANAGLQLGSCEPGKATRNVAPGKINDQTPAPGKPPPDNRLVQVWTEREVGVPDLRGQNCASAQKILAGVGLQLGACIEGQATGRFKPGQINEQTPAPEQPPPANRSLQVWTEREAPVPDLRGLNCNQARSILAQRELVLMSCEPGKPDGATSSGQINAQEPSAGSSLPADRNLRAWTAPPRVEVPNVKGQSAGAARSRLAEVGLQAHFTGPSARLGAGVRGEQPPAGSKVEEGTLVNLQMELAVPDLRGKTCAEAGKFAADYGFPDVACIARPVADSSNRIGTVYDQDPAAATALAAPAKIMVQVVAEPVPTLPAPVDQTGAGVPRLPNQGGVPAQSDVAAPADGRVDTAAPPPAGTPPEARSTGSPADGRVGTAAAPPPGTLVEPGSTGAPTATPQAEVPTPDWRHRSVLLAALLAGMALLVPVSQRGLRRWRDRRESPSAPTPAGLPALSLRGEPDSSPRITVKVADTPFKWPALSVRGEAGTPRTFLKLSDREDDDGSS
jgi:beta-lactam-binding protein with PASTA domain